MASPQLPVPLITNVMGASAEELSILLDTCNAHAEIAAIELNVSCPNVETGLDIGADPVQLQQVVRSVRPCTDKPLIVKLTPNTADVSACALAAERGGADALSLINTLRATALAPRARRSPPTPIPSPPPPGAWPKQHRHGLARWRHRRPFRSRDSRRRARPGRRRRRACHDSRHRNGRRAERRPRTRSTRPRRDARRRRHRELPRSRRCHQDRAGIAQMAARGG